MATHKTYTPEQKTLALQTFAEVGATKAAKQLGISQGTLYSWRDAANKAKAAKKAKKVQTKAKTRSAAQRVTSDVNSIEALIMVKMATALILDAFDRVKN